MNQAEGRFKYIGFLTLLIITALLLSLRLVYFYLADAQRFPITTIKVTASYQHITREQLENVLSRHLNATSFFTLSARQLRADLASLDWTQQVKIERIWPDTLKIILVEKPPVAIWNDLLMTADGALHQMGDDLLDSGLPKLLGPKNQQKDVLQIYQKLSKLLAIYGLQTAVLQLRDNRAWELLLTNGIQLYLGKRDLEKRLERFCKANHSIFANKSEQLSSVDLRYARGMAVQWKQQTGK